jgi:hypothetical protein
MSTIVLRLVKGSELTWQEVDDNFSNLNADKYQAGDNAVFNSVNAASYIGLPTFTGAIPGLVPASGSLGYFLRDDGTWAAAGGGGGGTPATPANAIQYNSNPAGTFSGSSNFLYNGTNLITVGATTSHTIRPAAVTGSTAALNLDILAGNAENETGGILTLSSGSSTGSAGGELIITTGTAPVGSDSGDLSITTGPVTSTGIAGYTSGEITISTGGIIGSSFPGPVSGVINITSGAGMNGSGSVSIATGAASNGSSGSINLNPGNSGNGGGVLVSLGSGGASIFNVNYNVNTGVALRIFGASGHTSIGNATAETAGAEMLQVRGNLSISSATLLKTYTTFTNGAGASAGTITNAPAAGNPTKWIPVDDNGTVRYIPAW